MPDGDTTNFSAPLTMATAEHHRMNKMWRVFFTVVWFTVGFVLSVSMSHVESPTETAGVASRISRPDIEHVPSMQKRLSARLSNKVSRIESMRQPIDKVDYLWLPQSVAEGFEWNWGGIGQQSYITNQSMGILQLNQESRDAMKRAIDSAVSAIRAIERARLQIVDQSSSSVTLCVPSSTDVTAPIERLETELKSILGESKSAIMKPKILDELKRKSSAVRGEQWYIFVRLAGDSGVEVFQSNQNSDTASWSNVIPDEIEHLVQVGEETLKAK